jgi:hypothetical protein
MPRAAGTYSRKAPAIGPDDKRLDDDGAAARQTVRVVPANAFPRPMTTAAPSVFAAGQAAKPKRKYGPRCPPDAATIAIRTDVPIPPRGTNAAGESAYAALWARMPVGGMVELLRPQSNAFVKWAQLNGVGKQLVRRNLGDDVYGCWRIAAKD